MNNVTTLLIQLERGKIPLLLWSILYSTNLPLIYSISSKKLKECTFYRWLHVVIDTRLKGLTWSPCMAARASIVLFDSVNIYLINFLRILPVVKIFWYSLFRLVICFDVAICLVHKKTSLFITRNLSFLYFKNNLFIF